MDCLRKDRIKMADQKLTVEEEAAKVARNELKAAQMRLATWVLMFLALPVGGYVLNLGVEGFQALGDEVKANDISSRERDDAILAALNEFRIAVADDWREIEGRISRLEADNGGDEQ